MIGYFLKVFLLVNPLALSRYDIGKGSTVIAKLSLEEVLEFSWRWDVRRELSELSAWLVIVKGYIVPFSLQPLYCALYKILVGLANCCLDFRIHKPFNHTLRVHCFLPHHIIQQIGPFLRQLVKVSRNGNLDLVWPFMRYLQSKEIADLKLFSCKSGIIDYILQFRYQFL